MWNARKLLLCLNNCFEKCDHRLEVSSVQAPLEGLLTTLLNGWNLHGAFLLPPFSSQLQPRWTEGCSSESRAEPRVAHRVVTEHR